jgi:4a-hydroxytetrahydrobiopterin dehydratase
MNELARMELKPPRGGGVSPLRGSELTEFDKLLGNWWLIVDEHHLEKEYKFKNFQSALDFTNKVGVLAEQVDHHPEICLTWGKAKVTVWTHSIGGLSEADFIFAAKSDLLIE